MSPKNEKNPPRKIDGFVSSLEGPTGPFSFSAAKFVDGLDQVQKSRLAAIDAELADLLDSAPMDKAQMQALIGEVLYMLQVA